MPDDPPIILPPERKATGALKLVAEDIGMLADAIKMLDERQRMQVIRPAPGVRPRVGPGGTVLQVDAGRAARDEPLPFECRVANRRVEVSPGNFEQVLCLIAAPGTIGAESHAETVEQDPADATWYFYTSVTLDAVTGAVTSTTAEWVDAEQSNTSTTFYFQMASVEISGGVVATPLEQYNYGPMLVIQKGGVTDTWGPILL